MFDLTSLTWSSLKLITESSSAENIQEDDGSSLREAFPAISDHRMVSPLHEKEFCNQYLKNVKCEAFWQIKWGNKLLLIGGHSKKSSDNMSG